MIKMEPYPIGEPSPVISHDNEPQPSSSQLSPRSVGPGRPPKGQELDYSTKSHKCEVCGKLFPNSQQLGQHHLVHSGLRKYRCSFCDKTFKQLSHIQQHNRMHTGERPFKCGVENCGKGFTQLANLRHHMTVHEKHLGLYERKQYQCTECNKTFVTQSSLQTHKNKQHNGEGNTDTIPCPYCRKSYTSEVALATHVYHNHTSFWSQFATFSGKKSLHDFLPTGKPVSAASIPQRFECQICHKKYSHESGLLKHMVIHPSLVSNPDIKVYPCKFCEKIFAQEIHLIRHVQMKNDDLHREAAQKFGNTLGLSCFDISKREAISETGRDRESLSPEPGSSHSEISRSERLTRDIYEENLEEPHNRLVIDMNFGKKRKLDELVRMDRTETEQVQRDYSDVDERRSPSVSPRSPPISPPFKQSIPDIRHFSHASHRTFFASSNVIVQSQPEADQISPINLSTNATVTHNTLYQQTSPIKDSQQPEDSDSFSNNRSYSTKDPIASNEFVDQILSLTQKEGMVPHNRHLENQQTSEQYNEYMP
ncbi:unnamed protein product [Owenia fusiformis]|uniref:C2H2-type domain-containing protein n=1 Tax=Owenia fusiformis TaxID=6347 RepID=A0A8S4MWF0_OWEFU|nr:unnamed protein product [Owenia fusiformis]